MVGRWTGGEKENPCSDSLFGPTKPTLQGGQYHLGYPGVVSILTQGVVYRHPPNELRSYT